MKRSQSALNLLLTPDRKLSDDAFVRQFRAANCQYESGTWTHLPTGAMCYCGGGDGLSCAEDKELRRRRSTPKVALKFLEGHYGYKKIRAGMPNTPAGWRRVAAFGGGYSA